MFLEYIINKLEIPVLDKNTRISRVINNSRFLSPILFFQDRLNYYYLGHKTGFLIIFHRTIMYRSRKALKHALFSENFIGRV